ncbi:MAG: phosphate transport system substrate-binding protein [Pseudomonadota bacterium]|nr:phosphate transport system substrate-binding protein [Pseudomonadota bacterium]
MIDMTRRIFIKATVLALLTIPCTYALAEDGMLRVGGSTTLLPVISTAASDFMAKFKTWNKVAPNLPEKPIVIFVTGGGSSFGVKSVLNGTVNIGMVSRDLKDKEVTSLGQHQTYLVGKDAVAIATSARNPMAATVTQLSGDAVARLFAGEIARYNDLDKKLPNREIVLLTRDAGAGSTEVLQEVLMKDKQISPKALQLPSQGALMQKLQNNTQAIGYISSGLVSQSDGALKSYALDGVSPSNENVLNGKYKLARPLNLLLKDTPDAYAKAFVDYVLSDGQAVVDSLGYVPAKR